MLIAAIILIVAGLILEHVVRRHPVPMIGRWCAIAGAILFVVWLVLLLAGQGNHIAAFGSSWT